MDATHPHFEVGAMITLTSAKTCCGRPVPYHLADAGIAGQHVGVLQDGQLGGSGGGDLQHTAPLGKVSAVLLVLGAAFIQSVKT